MAKQTLPPITQAVFQALQDAPETINPCTLIYQELALKYAFGELEIGGLVLRQTEFEAAVETGTTETTAALVLLNQLRALPSQSCQYVFHAL